MKFNNYPYKRLIFGLFLVFFVPACGLFGTSDIDTLSTVVAKTMTAVALSSPSASSSPEITAIPATPTDSVSTDKLYVKTTADNVNLRVSPGRLFQVSRILTRGSRVEYLGILPNGQWLKVRTGEGVVGWILKELVEADFELVDPLAIPDNVILITGTVLDGNNNPVNGIEISISRDEQSDSTLTIKEGAYYLYLPTTLSGVWSLKQTAISCESNLMGPDCKCLNSGCGTFDPIEYRLQFPLNPGLYDFVVK
ncbi:MAG: SH3 domain-containing protein [Anaerolineales bacterium]